MSMAGYTKLFNSILASTIWRASDKTRIVWITMLAMADKDGVVEGSIPGLSDFARVSLDDCEAALKELSEPDKYSRSEEFDGRRIEEIPGTGWQLLNHGKYRAKMSDDERREYNRLKQAEWRERQKVSKNVNYCQSQSAMSAHTEAEAEADTNKTSMSGKPDLLIQSKEILSFLNEKTGRSYQAVPSNLNLIKGRLREGATPAQCRQVITKKCRDWINDPKMSDYLRPATLFNATKFAQYIGELKNV